jgi:mRNA interferase RelE/StbE
MDTYRIEWKSSALKELKRLDRSVVPRLISVVHSLATNPRPAGVRKMKGTERSFRVRTGDYRIVYEVLDEALLVLVIRVRHRKDVYRD